jgi:hypothetical protein
MKLYSVSPGLSPALVELDTDILVLGEDSCERSISVIPIVGQGPDLRVIRTKKGIVLVRGEGNGSDKRCLALIRTERGYHEYPVSDVLDARKLMVLVTGTHGPEPEKRGKEVLALIKPGGEFRLVSRDSSYWYTWDGGCWLVESLTEREIRRAKIAVEEMKAGKGEWL